LAAGFGVAVLLSQEAYQADPAVCGFGGGESDPWGASDPVENLGFASLVERFCLCVEARGVFGNCRPSRVNAAHSNVPRVGKGRAFFLLDTYAFVHC